MSSVVELYRPAADDRRQTLTIDIAAGLDFAGDRDLLAQMFANLIENAVRHAPEGAAIAVAAATAGG